MLKNNTTRKNTQKKINKNKTKTKIFYTVHVSFSKFLHSNMIEGQMEGIAERKMKAYSTRRIIIFY